jgi:hypothetical protein
MAPEAFKSSDLVWKTFNIINLALFSLVIGVVLYYRRKKFSNKNSNN